MALYNCPKCGLRYDSAKAPGGACIGTWEGPLMLNPCTCVVPSRYFRNRDSSVIAP